MPSDLEGVFFCRLRVSGPRSSTSSEDAFRFLNDREPSRGSSSIIKVLKMECDSGLKASLCAGSRSLAILEVMDLRRDIGST